MNTKVAESQVHDRRLSHAGAVDVGTALVPWSSLLPQLARRSPHGNSVHLA
jgi:hypothetical protein